MYLQAAEKPNTNVAHRRTVSVIMTVKNDAAGCAVTLRSLAEQTRTPDEIILVDGGSTDDTKSRIRARMNSMSHLCLVEADGVNIAEGRNMAARHAHGEILACTDAGCRCHPDWLENLMKPFEEDPDVEIVGGFYKIEPASLLEEVVGLSTMRGQLNPVDPKTFNPSARSMACSKTLWERVGGWPEWLRFSEDTLFDQKARACTSGWRFAEDAIVAWRPRSSLRSIARQFYNYGTGRGQTKINAPAFAYNLRNVILWMASLILCVFVKWTFVLPVMIFLYFYVWAFHHTARCVVERSGRKIAYPLCLLVMWIVLFSHLAGYFVGAWQRRRDRNRYETQLATYLAVPRFDAG